MILDLIIVILVVLGALTGFKKGLVGILVSLVGLVLAIILAFTLQTPVANYLYTTGMGESIEQGISNGINETISNKEEGKESSDFYSEIVKNIAGETQISDASKNVTMFILKGISFIGTFLIVLIICGILRLVLNLVFDLPILNSVNKIGGIAAGALKSLVSIWIIFAIISFLSPLPALEGVISYIRSSGIAGMLYSNNLFVKIISVGLKLN